jgi:hypothetical protein
MRTKDEILESCRDDIQKPKYNPQAPLWLEYRKLEVLIDIRDMFDTRLGILFNLLLDWKDKS